jgi:hypothetical protein
VVFWGGGETLRLPFPDALASLDDASGGGRVSSAAVTKGESTLDMTSQDAANVRSHIHQRMVIVGIRRAQVADRTASGPQPV